MKAQPVCSATSTSETWSRQRTKSASIWIPRGRRLRSRESRQRHQFRLPLACQVARIGGQVRPAVDSSRGPADLDRESTRSLVAQPEMEPGVVGRLVAAAALALGNLAAASGGDRDPRADAVAVGFRALEPQGQKVPNSLGLVVEVGRRDRSGRGSRHRRDRRCRGRRRPGRGRRARRPSRRRPAPETSTSRPSGRFS